MTVRNKVQNSFNANYSITSKIDTMTIQQTFKITIKTRDFKKKSFHEFSQFFRGSFYLKRQQNKNECKKHFFIGNIGFRRQMSHTH